MHIGLLECDHVEGRVPGAPAGYREMFAALLGPHAPRLRFTYFDACHGDLPDAPQACDAYVCTGSKHSVYDRLDWIGPLADFLRRLHRGRRPYVGVCFGHQMLAHALGGEVAPAACGWGAGVHEMGVHRTEPWMRPALGRCRLQYIHKDQVTRLPADGVALARSAHCEVAMFRVGASTLGIEGHPEFTVPYGAALIRLRSADIGAARARAALDSLAEPTDAAVVGRWVAAFLAGGAA